MSLASLEAAVSGTGDKSLAPPVPQRLEDTCLTPSFIEQLLLKILYSRGETLGRELSQQVGLNFSVIEPIIEQFKRQRFIEAKKSLGMGSLSTSFVLSDTGRIAAREAMESNTYASVAPVPLHQYLVGVQMQRQKQGWLTKEALHNAYRHMVMTPQTLAQIGPAVSAGRSFLIYGQPGNGKTFLAEALFTIDPSPIYIPYAIECQGQIVQMYDPIYHQKLDDDPAESVFAGAAYDRRWFKARRPFLVTGGELTLDMLDLKYSPNSKTYDAPFQLKANNGIYLIDDFGRQRVTPAEVLNRWIVPMERRIDFLTFHTGGKMSVPFECFLVFSTNLKPDQLGDEAFLRRIQYKMMMPSPAEAEFTQIWMQFCQKNQLVCSQQTLEHFMTKYYRSTTKPMRRCHPRDIITHAMDFLRFEKMPFELTEEVLEHAFNSCFVDATQAMV